MGKKIKISAELEELAWEELENEDQELILEAKAISEDAYAPYSNFHVGAAAILNSGRILKSSNQENVSFPVGVCAERLLLGYAGANFPGDPIKKLAIVAKRKGEEVWASVSPCGLCRQTISETEVRFNQAITLLILTSEGQVLKIPGIQALLPFKFEDLNG
ncbi:cytidine deaminase [Algoriphagus lutimaris]|uniref:cytidine deaminase n=1 Tax=Algoriphagus lutimaris TaxID=613197 RepID=UPI00196A32E8|nr:cytidine deaminase [Algoriphagus lutimaris]MBN3521567.1 cytidine deaminase [Algoriphagus lutimaris]